MVAGARTVLITGARAPVALHLARLFHGAGWRVALADTPARPLAAASRCVATYYRLPPPRFAPQAYGDAVEALVQREQPALVIPTCEEIFYLASVRQERTLDAPLFAPPLALLQTVHNKFAFIELCQRYGLTVPETRLLTRSEDLVAIRPEAVNLVFKPVWSRFASRVLIAPSARELAAVRPTPQAPWVAQARLTGLELSAYAVAQAGRVVALSLYHSPYRAGKGAGIYFRPVEDAAAAHFIHRFVEQSGWTGQISFDLMRLEDGTVLPLECNPRATSGLHFFRNSAPFVAALCGDGDAVLPDITRPQTVRLAMWIYGLKDALRDHALAQFRADLRAADEIMDWPGDRLSAAMQVLSLVEIAGLALRERISLQQASTRDIEWDGPDQSAI